MKVKSLSRVRLFATPWAVVYQVLPSMGFFRQEYWNGLPFILYSLLIPISYVLRGLMLLFIISTASVIWWFVTLYLLL